MSIIVGSRDARFHPHLNDEIRQIGFSAPVANNIQAHQDDLVAISFTVSAAFEQTPGPHAGQAMTAAE